MNRYAGKSHSVEGINEGAGKKEVNSKLRKTKE